MRYVSETNLLQLLATIHHPLPPVLHWRCAEEHPVCIRYVSPTYHTNLDIAPAALAAAPAVVPPLDMHQMHIICFP